MLVIFRQNTKVIALLCGQKSHIFLTFQSAIKINQFHCWSVFGKIPRLQPYFLAKNRSFSSLFNQQSKSINFNVGQFSAIYQGYSLTFWPKIAHFFIMCQSAININQFQFWSFFGNIPRYCVTLWPKIAHFHHCSICNQNQSISMLVIFRQNTKVIALLFAKNRTFSSLFNLQSKSINFTVCQFSAKYQGYSLTFWPKIAHFHHF